MKLSVEAKVAAAITAGFVALTVGMIAQGNSGDKSAVPNGYGPTNNAKVGTHITQHGFDSSLGGYTNAEENRHRPE